MTDKPVAYRRNEANEKKRKKTAHANPNNLVRLRTDSLSQRTDQPTSLKKQQKHAPGASNAP